MTPDYAALLRRWWPDAAVISTQRLQGGAVNDTCHVETTRGAYVLRVYREDASEAMVAWEHALLARLAPIVPEAVAPLPVGGLTFVRDGGRLVALWPFVRGTGVERGDRALRAAAARLLGRVHRATAALGMAERPGWPSWVDLDWRENRLWSWSSGSARLDSGRVPVLDRRIEETMGALQSVRHLPRQPIHGDVSGQNMLAVDARIVALVDWDEARVDSRLCDLAGALWSFCATNESATLDRAAARRFMEAYEDTAPPLTTAERAALPWLIRAGRLYEALWALGEVQRGAAGGEYLQRTLSVVDRLNVADIS